jgi:2-haloacid dehalogenase
MAQHSRTVAIFDLGGVLIDWDPRHLYRKLFTGDVAGMEAFLSTVCTQEWNRCQDAGRASAEAVAVLTESHPHFAELIGAYYGRFDEMMAGPIEGTVEILAELRERGIPLYGLTNFSAETYPSALKRFGFLQWFRGVIVSGQVKAIKPDRQIYEVLLTQFDIDPHRAVFVDDVKANVEAAAALGIYGVHFTSPEALREKLVTIGLL